MKMQKTTQFVGVDVASAHLDVAVHGQTTVRRYANTTQGIGQLRRALPACSMLALESTGRYHAALAQAAYASGLCVYVLNPLDARRYAQSIGQRGKTDRIDVIVLARYVCREHEQLRQWCPPTDTQAELRELIAHRATLVRQCSALAQAGSHNKMLAGLDAPVLEAPSKRSSTSTGNWQRSSRLTHRACRRSSTSPRPRAWVWSVGRCW